MNEINLNNISIIKSSLKASQNENFLNTSSSNKHVSIVSPTSGNVTNENRKNKSATRNLKKSSSQNEPGKVPFYPASTQLSQTTKSFKKTIAENSLVPFDNEKKFLFSTWTPLSDEKSNQRLFEERKQLMAKWFETWNDVQRRDAIEEILALSKLKQLLHAREILDKVSPLYHVDFTRILPRVICLYIMSFLDPRSLSRCSQVSWYWKMLSESDQLWIPKCTRFGWNLNYIPTSFESGIWKQFYIENIRALQYIPIKKPTQTPISTERSEIINRSLHDLSYGKFGFNQFVKNGSRQIKNTKSNAPLKQPHWRSNNPNPNHFYRFNYLDEDEIPVNTNTTNEKKQDRLIKTLSTSTSALNASNTKQKETISSSKEEKIRSDLERNKLNQSKIEDLIMQGQHLINQINTMDSEFKTTGLLDPNKTPDLYLSNKNTSHLTVDSLINLQKNKPPTKEAWALGDQKTPS